MAAESLLDSIDEEWQAQQDSGARTPPKKRKGAPESDPGSSEKRPVGKAKAKVKAKAVRRSIVKKCKGCRKKLGPGEAAPNWPGCWPCKRSLDNIWKLAKKQGPKAVDYVSSARSDPDDTKLYNLIQSYNEKCPEGMEGAGMGRKRGTWSLMKYIERVTAASGLVRDCEGEMMWEKLYMEFAQTTRGGKMTEEAAQSQWNDWAAAVKTPKPQASGVMFDYEGPQGRLRIWVKTADKLIYRSQYMKEKEIYCEGETTKKATDEDVDKLRPELLRNHGANMDFDHIAPVLAQSGKDAFASNDGFMLDILDLQADTQDMEEDEQPPANVEAEKEPEAPKVWVERDRVVSASVRVATSQNEVFVQKGMEQLQKQEQAEKEVLAEMNDKQKEHLAGELKMWRVRLEAMAICFREKDPEALKRFIARFSSVEAADSSMPDQPVRMGACPPCELYAKLKTVDALAECAGKYQNATTPQHVKDCLKPLLSGLVSSGHNLLEFNNAFSYIYFVTTGLPEGLKQTRISA